MFEKSPDNALDLNIFADARNTGPQAAQPPDDEIDAHPGARRFVKHFDQRFVFERVHLENNSAARAVLDLSPYESRYVATQRYGGYQKLPEIGLMRIPGEVIEEIGRVRAELCIACEKTQIGIEARGGGVVIAGAQMKIAADAVLFPAHDERDLAVHLEADQPIDDMDALALQRTGPFDVALFVETRFQFHQHGNLLAVFDGFEKRLDNRRIAPHSIQRHLDREHIGIVGGFLQQIDNGLEGPR